MDKKVNMKFSVTLQIVISVPKIGKDTAEQFLTNYLKDIIEADKDLRVKGIEVRPGGNG